MSDKEILKQPVSDEEMAEVSGGEWRCTMTGVDEADPENCVGMQYRDITAGGFPNCAATVESGSWCGKNDACSMNAVVYKNISGSCSKAWK